VVVGVSSVSLVELFVLCSNGLLVLSSSWLGLRWSGFPISFSIKSPIFTVMSPIFV
jgi:hypothetical protein